MMQASTPIDTNIIVSRIELPCALDGSSSIQRAEVPQPIKDWTIIPNIEASKLVSKLLCIVWSHTQQEVHVIICVELQQLIFARWARAEHLHVLP